MALTITHAKTNDIPDWTQADLDAQIALGNFPPGTVLADITLPSDWNANHTLSGSIAWGEITGALSNQTDLQTALNAKGDVTGPASSVDNAITRFDGTTGKIIQDYTSGAPTISDTGAGVFNNTLTVATTSASAFAVGPNGATNPALLIDNSQASGNTGWSITSGAGTRTTITVISPNSNENGDIMAKANGALRVGTTGSSGTFNVRLGTTNYMTVTNSLTTISTTSVSLPTVTVGVWNGSVIGSAYGGAGTVNGILKANGSGTVSAATAGTDYTNASFSTISVSGQSDVVADSAADTLTLVAGSNITITTNAGTDAITIAASGSVGSSFTDITSGTNTTAAMVVGTGATLDVSGSGTINSTSTVVANEATDTTCFLNFTTAATGSLGIKTNANLTWNSNTALLGLTGTQVITSSSAAAFGVGQNGATNPAFNVDASTASSVSGLSIKSQISGAGPLLESIGGSNEPMTIRTKGSGQMQIRTAGSGAISLQPNGTATRYNFTDTAASFTPTTSGTAATVRFGVTAAADTGLTAGTEAPWIYLNGGVTRQHASNTAITTQRDIRIDATTHSFASSGGVITDGSTVYISGPPIAGTNATITNPWSLYVASGNSFFSGAIQSTTIELGAASDTTLSRSSAGVLAVEGVVVPTISSTNTLTNKRITPRVSSTASSATPTPNADTDDEYILTALAAGATFAVPSGTPTQGQAMFIRIKDNGSAQTLAFNAIYRAIGVTLPTTTVISKTMYIGMIYNSTDTKWDVLTVAQEA